MKVKGIVFEDFANYKKPAMFINFPTCTFKCDKECGRAICQNGALVEEKDIEIGVKELTDRYVNNPITKAIVIGGLEPFDSMEDLTLLVTCLRVVTDDDIVIYTGYKEEELEKEVKRLSGYENIIIKFGRFIPDKESHFDEILGVNLSSPNQYAKKI